MFDGFFYYYVDQKQQNFIDTPFPVPKCSGLYSEWEEILRINLALFLFP
jgi:hypothetical protein